MVLKLQKKKKKCSHWAGIPATLAIICTGSYFYLPYPPQAGLKSYPNKFLTTYISELEFQPVLFISFWSTREVFAPMALKSELRSCHWRKILMYALTQQAEELPYRKTDGESSVLLT